MRWLSRLCGPFRDRDRSATLASPTVARVFPNVGVGVGADADDPINQLTAICTACRACLPVHLLVLHAAWHDPEFLR